MQMGPHCSTVAAGILPAVEPLLSARRKNLRPSYARNSSNAPWNVLAKSGRQDAALYVRLGSLTLPHSHFRLFQSPFLSFNISVIALLDYGSGNLRSVHKSLLKVGANVRLVQHPE